MMVRATCLSPMKATINYCSSSFAHMENLIFKLRTVILLFEAITEQTYKANNKNNREPYTKTKEKLKRAYGRIGLAATVTRT